MLQELNDHPIRRANIRKSSTGKLLWLRENLGTTLANGFHGLVHVLDLQTEVPDAVSVLVNPIA